MKLKPFLPILISGAVFIVFLLLPARWFTGSSTVFSVTKPVNQRAGNNRKTMNTAPLIKMGKKGFFQTVGLLLEIQNKLDIEVSIMDFDRDEWATPNKIVEALEELR
jgi:D-alanine--poly(phosphoribitol) ligase subunit 2